MADARPPADPPGPQTTAAERRRRIAVAVGFGAVAGLLAAFFTQSAAFGALFGLLMALPGVVTTRSGREAPVAAEPHSKPRGGPPRRRLSITFKAVLAGAAFAALRLAGELREDVEATEAIGRAVIVGALFGVVFWLLLYAYGRRRSPPGQQPGP